jgi:Putative zinc-RING and/or ribbon
MLCCAGATVKNVSSRPGFKLRSCCAAARSELPASWQALNKAALVFGAARNAPDVTAARRALIQRCLSDLSAHAPMLFLRREVLEFLGAAHADVPRAYVAWAARADSARSRGGSEGALRHALVTQQAAAAVASGGGGGARRMRLTAAEPLAESDEDLARMQRGACHGCGAPLAPSSRTGSTDGHADSVFSRAASLVGASSAQHSERSGRRCHFDGWLYCHRCHSGRTAAIPANIVEAWSFKKLPVCDDAADFLAATHAQPLIAIDAETTPLLATVPLLGKVHATRARIAALVSRACRSATDSNAAGTPLAARVEAALARSGHRRYLLEGAERWSVADLKDVSRGAAFALLPEWLGRQEAWLQGLVGSAT